MRYYQLENKSDDALFLKGEIVHCRAVLSKNDSVRAGQPLVVALSSGTRYKGLIQSVELVQVDTYLFGNLEIVRSTR